MKKLILAVFIIPFSVLLHAQHDFKPGYVVTLNNDTIRGYIDNNPAQENAIQCNFKKDSVSDIKTYKASELKEFAFNESKHYYSKNVKMSNTAAPYFLECISQGIISLYCMKNFGNTYFFIEKSTEIYELRNDPVSYVENGTTYTTTSNKYKGVFLLLMNDAPAPIPQEIENTSFNRKSFIKLLEKYHSQINKVNEFRVYNADDKKDKAKWIFKYGVALALNSTFMNTKGSYTTEALWHPLVSGPAFPSVDDTNMPGMKGNQNKFFSFNCSPGLFMNLSNNSKNSIQFEFSFLRKKIANADFSLTSNVIILPLIYKREFRYYKQLKPFVDIGFCVYHEENIKTDMRITISEPYYTGSSVKYTRNIYEMKDEPSLLNMTNHYGFLAGLGLSYPITKKHSLEFELRFDYTRTQFNNFYNGVTVYSGYQYLNSGLITRFCF